jgi:hypothetical protein
MPPTTLLALMLATYAIPIVFVYYKYTSTVAAATDPRSISSIITSKEPFITLSENAPPPRIHDVPNPALYRSMYALDGGIHPRL